MLYRADIKNIPGAKISKDRCVKRAKGKSESDCAKERKMKLSLDETWHYCLEMWKSIAKKAPKGLLNNIENAKVDWLKKNGFNPLCIISQCFFCDYISRYDDPSCNNCPGREIDPKFDCIDDRYCYYASPKKFYAKLVKLNKIRLCQIPHQSLHNQPKSISERSKTKDENN